ncbi:DUF4837 family protein [bacterium]|nr:DUF4837 family protein [bacterium]
MKHSIFTIILILAVLFIGCSNFKSEAIGSFNSVYAFADDEELDLVEEPLEIAIAQPIITPRPERLFRIFWGDTTNFDNATKHHIVLVAASFESPGHFGALVRMSLSKAAYDSVMTGKYNIFVKHNPWSKNQILVILTAPTADQLRAYILTHTDEIFDQINDYTDEHVAQWIFSKFQGKSEKFDIEKKIADDYGFKIRVPRMFDWEKGTAEKHFLWLRALEPERWVFVYWTLPDSAMKGKISLKWLVHTRDSLCAIYYEGDSIVDGTLTYEHTNFHNIPAIKYRARWKNRKAVAGGPVVGYIFDDTLHNRRYILDGAVFAPGIRKEPYLRHCEVIMRSFDFDTL